MKDYHFKWSCKLDELNLVGLDGTVYSKEELLQDIAEQQRLINQLQTKITALEIEIKLNKK